jgi:hypothetical protein
MRKKAPKEMLKFRADPVLRRAIRLKAALNDMDLQDVIGEILRKGLSAEIEEVQRRGLVQQQTVHSDQAKKSPRKS